MNDRRQGAAVARVAEDAAQHGPQERPLHPQVVRRLRNPARLMSPPRTTTSVSERYAMPVHFCTDNPKDRIHINHARGSFYEERALQRIAAHMPAGGVFVDAGANVGNHTLYMLLLGGAGTAMPFEMNPRALKLLLANIHLNGLADRVTLDTLGYGLGGAARDGVALHSPKGNLGWTRVDCSAEGDVSIRTGDELIDGRPVDFIKVDVEGMEVEVLMGLQETIAARRPGLFVEVDHENRAAFDWLMTDWDYRLVESFSPSNINQNLLLLPQER